MKCYNCGHEITDKSQCPSCRKRVDAYIIVMRKANTYYNKGLKLANNRELSEAIDQLKECLTYNKNHTDARNLLGLIYYEIGEVGLAEKTWRLSLYHQAEENNASRYLKNITGRTGASQKREAIEKYNQALYCAYKGSLDMARLQIKKSVELNPKLMKAQCLLALLYMQEEKNTRAHRVLKKAYTIDKSNKLLNYYLMETEEKTAVIPKRERLEDKQEEEVKQVKNGGVLIPKYRESKGMLQSFMYIFSGLVLGCVAAWFLFLPSVKQQLIQSNNQSIGVYSQQLSAKDTEIVNLESQITELTDAKAKAEKKLAGYTGENGVIDTYDNMLSCLKDFIDDDYLGSYDAFSKLKRDAVNDSVYKKIYDSLKEEFSTNAEAKLYEAASSYYKKRDFKEAIPYYLACLELNADNPECMYWLALSYHNTSQKEKARTYYNKLIKEYSTTFYGKQSAIYIKGVQ